MYENPNDELYFGEVYRQVLQEAWLPEGAEVWSRLGISRRGRRPTQRGITPHSPTEEQAVVRRCFSKCVSAWNSLPWDTPHEPGCDDRWGREYWKKEKDDRGVPCSYYDLFMRYCLRHCLDTGCVMPSAYTLDCGPPLTDVICFGEYNLPISGECGSVSLSAGPGDFSPPSTWTAPLCGDKDDLYFEDSNGATGCVPITFDPAHFCVDFTWPVWNPDEIPPGGSAAIYILGGLPPYHWLVSGTGFSLASSITVGLTNAIIAGPGACGSATILVKDSCDRKVYGSVRCEAGHWVLLCSGKNLSGTCSWVGRKWYDVFPDPKTKLTLGLGCHMSPYKCLFYSCNGYTSYIPSAANNKCPRTGDEIECDRQDSSCVHANVHLVVYKWKC